MTLRNFPTEPPDVSATAAAVLAPPAEQVVQAATRKRRWPRRILLTLVALTLGLVVMTPTILSTSRGREFLLRKLNARMDGHITAGGGSIGWFSGLELSDVEFVDVSGARIVHIRKFSSQLSLLDAFRGKFHMGDTVFEDFEFVADRDASGIFNFEKLHKTSRGGGVSAKAASTKLTPFDGVFHLVNGRGAVHDARTGSTMLVTSLTGDVRITNFNSPIETSLRVVANSPGGSELAHVNAVGTILIAKEDRLLDAREMNIEQALDVSGNSDVAHAALRYLMPRSDLYPQSLAGTVDVKLDHRQLTLTPKLTLTSANLAYLDATLARHLFQLGNIGINGEAVIDLGPIRSGLRDGSQLRRIGHIDSVHFNSFAVSAFESSVNFNGVIDDPRGRCNFMNFRGDLTYHSKPLWNAILAGLAKNTQEVLKELQFEGTNTRTVTFTGSLRGDLPFDQAILGLAGDVDLLFDRFLTEGIVVSNARMHLALADGKLRIVWPKDPRVELEDCVIEVANPPKPTRYLSGSSTAPARAIR